MTESEIKELPTENALEEPHFEDEATVLSARPVVPLTEVRANKRDRRWTVALIVGVALVFGVLGAVLISSMLQSQQAAPVVADETNLVQRGPVDGGVVGMAEPAPEQPVEQATEQPVAPETTPAKTDNVAVTPKRNTRPARTPVKVATRPTEEELERRRELRRAERREARLEERRQRRVEKQARRSDPGRPRRVGNDPLRIEEIFEGVRRP